MVSIFKCPSSTCASLVVERENGVRCKAQANQRLSKLRLSGQGQRNYTSELCIVWTLSPFLSQNTQAHCNCSCLYDDCTPWSRIRPIVLAGINIPLVISPIIQKGLSVRLAEWLLFRIMLGIDQWNPPPISKSASVRLWYTTPCQHVPYFLFLVGAVVKMENWDFISVCAFQ